MSSTLHRQSGAITIMVALMLLVLLTVAAVGMSRNSFREVVISGTSRQGSMVRNSSDAGLEWALYWMDLRNVQSGVGTGSAVSLNDLKVHLLQTDTSSGQPFVVQNDGATGVYSPYTGVPAFSDLAIDLKLPGAPVGQLQGFSLALTRMGKLPITDMSQGLGPSAYAPSQGGISKQAPDLWAVRSDSQVQVAGGITGTTFVHSKEAWISTPVQ